MATRGIDKRRSKTTDARLNVLSTRLTGGQALIHVLADSRPEEGFEAVPPDLEDVYFGQLPPGRGARAA